MMQLLPSFKEEIRRLISQFVYEIVLVTDMMLDDTPAKRPSTTTNARERMIRSK